MGKYKIPSIEYSTYLGNQLCEYFKNKNLKEAIYYNTEFFKPKNFVYRIYDINRNNNPDVKFRDVYNEFKKYRTYYKKIWNGEDLTGKTIFVFKYLCGWGDYIIFCRYIHLLEEMAAKVIVEVEGNLFDLYKYSFPKSEVIPEKPYEQDIQYDYTCHHEHFLNFLKNTDSFPYSEGYLKASPQLIEEYKPIFNTDKFKVGIYHEGKSDNDDRHIRIKKMFPIFENKQCQFYTLNSDKSKDYTKEVHDRYNIIELQPYIKNAHDTAALMMNMDLVISVDSFPPNLSGALGIKTYMLLHDDAGWRWFDNYYTTPWYNSMRLFRRTPYTTIEDQINEVATILKQDCLEYYANKS